MADVLSPHWNFTKTTKHGENMWIHKKPKWPTIMIEIEITFCEIHTESPGVFLFELNVSGKAHTWHRKIRSYFPSGTGLKLPIRPFWIFPVLKNCASWTPAWRWYRLHYSLPVPIRKKPHRKVRRYLSRLSWECLAQCPSISRYRTRRKDQSKNAHRTGQIHPPCTLWRNIYIGITPRREKEEKVVSIMEETIKGMNKEKLL